MLKLFIENKELQDSVVPIRWLLDEDTVKRMGENKLTAPLLLLVARGEDGVEHREVVPLKQLMHYLQLRTSGEIEIFAGVVYSHFKTHSKIKKKIL